MISTGSCFRGCFALLWTCFGMMVGAVTLENPSGRLGIDETNGRLTGVWVSSCTERVLNSSTKGLWRLDFEGASSLGADEAKFGGVEKTRGGLSLSWTHPRADVTVRIISRDDGFEWTGEVTARAEPVIEFVCPAELRFRPESVARFVAPHTRIDGYGYAFNSGYFKKNTDWITGWKEQTKEGRGWKLLFNDRFPALRDSKSPAEPVKVTDEGRKFLSADAVAFIERTPVPVLRPPVKEQYDVAWAESKSGPLVSGSHLGGKGTFWRLGTWGVHAGRDIQEEILRHYVEGTLKASAAARGGACKRLGFIRLQNGQTDLTYLSVERIADWLREFSSKLGLEYVELENPKAIAAAEEGTEFAAIVNPYEEHLPVEVAEEFDAAVNAVAAYVRAGGNWIECGGASFFSALVPNRYFVRRITYPTAFVDLQRLETVSGVAVTLYGVQPRPPHAPWKAKRRFQVAMLEHGADAKGGYFRHGYRVYAKKGERSEMPAVRLRLGGSLDALLKEYAEANTLDRRLSDKIRPETLDRLVRGVFFKSSGTAKELRSMVKDLPPSTTLHLACYLKGGFDKEYPDHLPVRPQFGTDEEFRALIDELHAAGHFFSPYTNPTWWCDHPRGPSFVAAGEDPLLMRQDGSRSHEMYGPNDGWTVTFWHPAVQAANRQTVRRFVEDFPSDLLFQDQTGGRGTEYDFNPVAPSPDAYCEGLLSQIEEDSIRLPLGCEDGWDRVANVDLAIFGTTFQLIPTRPHAEESHNVLIKNSIPPHLWTIEPLSAKLMHDKTLFYLHDLGESVWDRRGLAWCMGLGINLSYNLPVNDLRRLGRLDWLNCLARIQREAMSRIAGKRLTSFVHDRAPLFARKIDPMTRLDDGAIVSVWEDVEVKANLGDVPRQVANVQLEPYGWTVRWPGGTLSSRDVFGKSRRKTSSIPSVDNGASGRKSSL